MHEAAAVNVGTPGGQCRRWVVPRHATEYVPVYGRIFLMTLEQNRLVFDVLPASAIFRDGLHDALVVRVQISGLVVLHQAAFGTRAKPWVLAESVTDCWPRPWVWVRQ